jgi:hypothetical protein
MSCGCKGKKPAEQTNTVNNPVNISVKVNETQTGQSTNTNTTDKKDNTNS